MLAPIPVCRYARFKERSRVPLALTRRRRALVRRAKIGRPPRRKPRGKKEEGGDHPAPTHTSTMAVADPEDAEEAVVELDSDDSDAAGGTEDETPNDVAGTDDDVPTGGENYFGRAAKEGAAPVGANPFAMPAPSADDDWMREIEEAKRMVEAQRIKREREEAVERQKEIEAAEAKGKVYEERRKAGDSPAPVSGTGGQGGRRERKIVRAKRPTGGGGMTPTSGGDGGGGGASPFAAFSFAPPPAEDTPVQAASPFNGGFSLLSTPAAEIRDAGVDVKPGGGGGIMSRLSGAPKPFVEPEPEPEPEEEEEEEPKAAPFSFQAAHAPAPVFHKVVAPPAPKSTTSAPGRTALAVELDL